MIDGFFTVEDLYKTFGLLVNHGYKDLPVLMVQESEDKMLFSKINTIFESDFGMIFSMDENDKQDVVYISSTSMENFENALSTKRTGILYYKKKEGLSNGMDATSPESAS